MLNFVFIVIVQIAAAIAKVSNSWQANDRIQLNEDKFFQRVTQVDNAQKRG